MNGRWQVLARLRMRCWRLLRGVRFAATASLRSCSLLLACSGLSLGCAWGSVGAEVVAPTARYPISMTKVVPDSDGRLLRESHELEIVAPLEVEQTNWNLAYGQALNEIDFSEQLNQQVEAAHGEAITHM